MAARRVRHWRGVLGVFVLGWVALASAAPRSKDAPGSSSPLKVQLTCPTREGAGRVVCELDMAAPSGRTLRWADALVLEAPRFARPLRARVAGRVSEEGASRITISLPLFASAETTGIVRVRARAVACAETACVTLARDVSTSVTVERAAE